MFWDGGISRGLLCSQVPYANTQKDHIKKTPPVATGLWSRGGKAIQAPAWFLDSLPNIPLDGEAWAGVGRYQFVSQTIRKDIPTEDWKQIRFMVFDSPCFDTIFADGKYKIREHEIELTGTVAWAKEHAEGIICFKEQPALKYVYERLKKIPETCWELHKQIPLPYGPPAKQKIKELLEEILPQGHEGLIVRDPMLAWTPIRSSNMLKIKPWEDAEAEVIGFTFGKKGKEGKFHGLMGALIVRMADKEFKVSGFTDQERTLSVAEKEQSLLSNTGS
jgi:DNA ligase-1